MGANDSPASKGKAPRTARGEKTLRKILDAALLEFGQRGFHDSSIVGITSRAKVALGTFYTYFDSKEAVFAALVRDMSRQVRDHVAPDIEGAATRSIANGARWPPISGSCSTIRKSTGSSTKPSSSIRQGFSTIMRTAAARIAARLEEATAKGQMRDDGALATEVRAWAIMGMNVFLGCASGCGAGRIRSWWRPTPTTCCARPRAPRPACASAANASTSSSS